MLLEKSGEITPERMKSRVKAKKKKNPVVDVTGDGSKSDDEKSNIE